MAHSLKHRLPVLLVATAAASALAAGPALATEGPDAPPPTDTLPSDLGPVTFTPFPSETAPATRSRKQRVVRRMRITPRRVRPGQRARLRLSLTAPSQLRIKLSRTIGKRRVVTRTIIVPARGRNVSVRLPARAHGHQLRPDSYRVRVVAVDAQGQRSLPARRSFAVRRAAR